MVSGEELRELLLQGEEERKNNKLLHLLNSVPGGIGIYQWGEKGFRQIYLNDGFFELLGDTRANREAKTMKDPFQGVHPEDRKRVEAAVREVAEGKTHLDLNYRLRRADCEYIWMRFLGRVIAEKDGNRYIYGSFFDVDDQTKAQVSLEQSQRMLGIAMKSVKLSSWTFDVKRRLIIQAELSRQQNGQDKVIYNVPESILEEGIVHPGSIQDFRELFQTMVKEEEDTQASSLEKEICFRSRGETGYRWERVIVTPIFDENHQHIRSVGTSLDITKEKTAVQQYKNELQMIDKANAANLITKSRYNLTKNNMEFIESGEKSQGKRLGDSTYDRSLERVIRVAVEPEKQEELRAVFNRETLIHKYHEGSRGFSLEYQRHRGEASVIWARTECRTFEEPYSGDIICFFYSYDISEKKFSEEMIKTVVDLDYDYLARINCLENTYTLYTQKQKCADILVPLPYDERIVQYARKFLPPEEVEANIRQMSIENLKAQLETAPSYSFFCKVVGRDGKVRRKKMQASYLNRASEQILMTRMDITDLYEREQKRLSELGAAMERVEEANRAKTEFLSRMSHDIRTPLNAVLGLSGLGKESGSLEEAHEYLEKIELSGGYLLSIINEVLSLSKIESKTMELHLKPISVPRFIQDVLAVVAPAAKEKGISLEVNKEKVHCLNLLLDKVYVQQVLVNLLSNAIKFTNPGGRVWLILEEVSQKAGYVQSRVVVKDTGIGISKAFFPKLFQPFEQEGGAEDLQRQGTGLGLSIVKSLVEYMGGTIKVESQLGIGSTFTVDWEFKQANEEEVEGGKTKKGCFFPEQGLAGKRILLAEDHPLNTEIAKKILEKKGIQVDCVVNGKLAVEQFSASAPGDYHGIILDIRMPIMDGLEAARGIRRLGRKDAKQIPIIAMSANAFEDDVQKSLNAGMDAHLSKPVEPEKLFKTLRTLL